VTNEWTDTA